MRARRRWAMVAAATAAAVVLPNVGEFIPARSSEVSARALLEQIGQSRSVAWSGDVDTQGTLQIPDTDSFAGVARLFGERNDVRVWWLDPTRWRADLVRQTGETDLVREGGSITSWALESNTATVTPYSAVRLPDVSDLLPNQLAHRLLGGARDAEVRRIDTKRIAGRDAPGLRLTPAGDQTTIGRVEVWADAATGLPLRVEVYGAGTSRPVLTSQVKRLDTDTPSGDDVSFTASPQAKVRSREAIDLAAGANAFAPFTLPDTIADLARRGDPTDLGAVGVYGRGPTSMVAIPLRRRIVGQVRDQLSKAASARQTDAGTTLSIGPLSVLLTSSRRGGGTFLLAGTLTPQTLANAATDLVQGVQVR